MKPRLTISGSPSLLPVCLLMAMIGSTMPSSEIMAAVADDHVADHFVPSEPESMQTRPTVTRPRFARAVVVEFQRRRSRARRFLPARRCADARQARMLGQLPVFAVDRHEIARPHQIQHQLQFFHRCRVRKRAAADSCCRRPHPRRACARWLIMR
jgi:hypothetical protein